MISWTRIMVVWGLSLLLAVPASAQDQEDSTKIFNLHPPPMRSRYAVPIQTTTLDRPTQTPAWSAFGQVTGQLSSACRNDDHGPQTTWPVLGTKSSQVNFRKYVEQFPGS